MDTVNETSLDAMFHSHCPLLSKSHPVTNVHSSTYNTALFACHSPMMALHTSMNPSVSSILLFCWSYLARQNSNVLRLLCVLTHADCTWLVSITSWSHTEQQHKRCHALWHENAVDYSQQCIHTLFTTYMATIVACLLSNSMAEHRCLLNSLCFDVWHHRLLRAECD